MPREQKQLPKGLIPNLLHRNRRSSQLTAAFLLSVSALAWPNWLSSAQRGLESAPASDVWGHGPTLKLGQSIEQELSAGQADSYPIELASGHFFRVEVYSPGLSLVISLVWPGQQKRLEWHSVAGAPTPIASAADVTGTYQLKVRALKAAPDGSKYKLVTKAPRRATAQDQKQVVACQAFSDANQLRRQWTAVSFKKAINKYEETLPVWRALGDRSQEAATLKSLGDVNELLSEYEKALSHFSMALRIYKELKDRKGQAGTLSAISAVHANRGDNQRALDASTRALENSRAVDDAWGQAQALHCMGAAYYGFSETPKAIDLLSQALVRRRALHDRQGEAQTLLFLGYSHHALKDIDRAAKHYHQSLLLSQDVEDIKGQARALTALGHLSNIAGESQQALSYYDRSLQIFRDIGHRGGQSGVLYGMALLYAVMGDTQKALDYYFQTLTIARELRDATLEAFTLTNIGEVYRGLGNYQKALLYSRQSVLVNRSMASILGEAYALANQGKAFEALGNTNGAMENYTRALELSQKGGDPFLEALLLNAFGHVHHASGQLWKALDYYQQAFSLQQKVNDAVRVPSTLYNLARAERDQGNLDRSIRYAEQALEISESLRGKVASRQLRGSFLASVHQQYELTIDLLMRQHKQRSSEGFDAAGLQASERARSRNLLDMLTEARLDIRQGVEPDLLERERSLQRLLNAKAERQTRLLTGKHDDKTSAGLAKEIGELATEYEQVQGQIRSKSPRYAALMQPQPLDLQEIQQQVLDDKTLLLEYALGDERSYLWAVSRTTITSSELPKRTVIEKAARDVYDLLIARQPKPGETAQQHYARVSQADAQYWRKAALLSEMLLVPVASQLGTKRLLIVAEGALQYVPFGALPKPGRGVERKKAKGEREKSEAPETKAEDGRPKAEEPRAGDKDNITPLSVDHEIVNLPSASVIAVLRRETRQRKAAAKGVAVLADPVFEADDPRLTGITVTQQPVESESVSSSLPHITPPPSHRNPARATPRASASPRPHVAASARPLYELQRALRDVGVSGNGLTVPRLLSTRQEAEAIFSVVPPGEGLKALGFDASRATATSSELGQYRIVHFATHGLMNNEHPELSGLVLSLVDERGRPQDGFLRLHDIYNLNLPADLVVLSACNTGLGKDVRGEGLVGIVRGFMYAGAARVVASLWKVDDDATAELMKRFYQRMLQGGMTPAAALRSAQVEMWQHKQWRSPYYWAAFTLQGEWR
ncbi:MAG: CHAT domain-containing protein [Acidobacteria bacterium]|nr:CHAT domain-containing protein [Acidobacteriota bacterium]